MAKLSEKIEALIAYANETTGKSDTHLGDAVKSLADGYGQGGEGLHVLEGKVTTTELKNNIVIEHNLGVRPIAAIVEIEGEYETPNTIMAIGCYMMLGKFSGSSNAYGSLAAATLNTNGTISYNGVSYLSDTTSFAGSLTEEYVKAYSSNGSRKFQIGTYNYKIIYAKDGGGDDVTKIILEGTATEVVIPEGVTAIRNYAFRDWAALKRISFPNSLRTIGNSCFYGCTNLMEVNLREGVKYIGSSFTTSLVLPSLTIPASVTEMASNCLDQTHIVEIVMKGDVPPTLKGATTTLPQTSDLKIYVPDSAIDAYKTKGYWQNYASRIFPMSSYPQ